MNYRGQGALEYLLIIGGAVLVAAIVLALITGTTTGVVPPQANAACAQFFSYTQCTGMDCSTKAKCEIMPNGTDCYKCTALKADGSPATGATDFTRCTAATAKVTCPTT